jgi:hypothetical protein
LKANLDQVLRAAAEVAMTLDRVQGIIVGVRLYSVIEDRAHQLGLELSRRIPAQQMGTLAAVAAPLAKYAECGTRGENWKKTEPSVRRRLLRRRGTVSGGSFKTVLLPVGPKGFVVLPKRWTLERTFGWLRRYRRHSKDYKRKTASSEATICAAMSHTMLQRLAPAKS